MEMGWTVDTLKEHFDALRDADGKAVSAALVSAEKAVAVAETNAEKWRENANEWRGAMTDREKNFLPRDEFDIYKTGTEKALNLSVGKGEGLAQGWAILIAATGLIATILGVAAYFH